MRYHKPSLTYEYFELQKNNFCPINYYPEAYGSWNTACVRLFKQTTVNTD